MDKQSYQYLSALIKMPISIINRTGKLLMYMSENEGAEPSMALLRFITDERDIRPMIFQTGNVHFASFCWDDSWYVLGPCSFQKISFSEQHEFAHRFVIKGKLLDIVQSDYQTLKNALLYLYYQISGKCFSEKEIWENYIIGKENIAWKIEEKTQFQYHAKRQEEGKDHANYERERIYYEHIIRGERITDFAVSDTKTDVLNRVGHMADNTKKQYEYLAVSTISMATRAAIEGGVVSGRAYELSDLYLQCLEKCSTHMEMMKLCIDAMNDFADEVASVHRERLDGTDYVEKCKAYLFQNLKKKITLEEIADQIGLNASYLSRIFSQRTGMSITQYFQKEKLKLAANFLRYSDYEISEIADYLSYSSQSKFGAAFKKEYHMTPSEYRKKYQVSDFV